MDSAMRRCLVAWHDLASTRPSILGARTVPSRHGPIIVPFTRRGAIPHDKILSWAGHHRLDYEVTELVIAVIARLDHDREEALTSKETLQ